MTSILKRAWIPLLILVVVAVAGFTVHRIRGFFGSEGIITTPLSMEIPCDIKSVTRTATKVAKPLKGLTDRRPRARVTLRAGAGECLGGADLGLPHHQLER